MKNIKILLISGMLVGSILGWFGNSCFGKKPEVKIQEKTVEKYIRVRDTLVVEAMPKTVKQKVFVVDSSGILAKNTEIERLQNYCNSVLAQLDKAYASIREGENKQVELVKLLAEQGEVELGANHYAATKYSEKTGVVASVEFDTYGYVVGDTIKLILDDTDAIQSTETTKTEKAKRRGTGIVGGFDQQIGGEQQQRATAMLYRRTGALVIGIEGSMDIENKNDPYIGVRAGIEFGSKNQ